MTLKISRSAMMALVGLLAAGAVLGIWLGTRGGEQAAAPTEPLAVTEGGELVAPEIDLQPADIAPAPGAGLTGLDGVLAGGEIDAEQDLTVPRIGIEDAVPLLGSEDVIWVDTRTGGEFAEGHIQGAISLPAYEQDAALIELPQDKEIIVYCA